jgi:hypothetical protein
MLSTTEGKSMWMNRFQLVALSALACAFCASRASAADDATVKAVEQGVGYLKTVHQAGPKYDGGSHGVGSASIAGLALLESGVPATGAVLKNITEYVRKHALSQTKTYETSLAVVFLDRLGSPLDKPVIQILAVRIMAGQSPQGSWTYDCGFALSKDETTRLAKLFYGGADKPPEDGAKGGPRPREDLPVDPKSEPKKDPDPKSTPVADDRKELHPEAARFARWISTNRGKQPGVNALLGDNSNTQFAVLALWVARKHGVPCDNSLALVDKHFRATQQKDGGWLYSSSPIAPPTQSPAMTCSGLLGLAAARATQAKPVGKPLDDRAIGAAFKHLESILTSPQIPAGPMFGIGIPQISLLNDSYFLWSLERVAVIYDVDMIGKIDWYRWGADHLIKSQGADGSWTGNPNRVGSTEVATSFAVLFLNRANVARDLTSALRGGRDVKLPNPVVLPDSKVETKQTAPSELAQQANRMYDALLSADATARSKILAQLRESKGGAFTDALARAAAKLQGEAQREAREALSLRLKRMTPATLREMLKDDSREIRCAAAVACALKEDKQFAPDLIAALADADGMVTQSARTSLRTLSGKDFGPASDGTDADKAKAITAWKAWWAQQPK